MSLCPIRNAECAEGDCEWWVDLEELNTLSKASSFEGGCAVKALAIVNS